ncbi:DUF1924 domain-containing protein [Azospirillum sp.]|uniref:DUF1924 domain-containing protein n=1 Tax=Azospirillum sp. TaxID=34012 RepID=UPI002623B2DC|nr:DUF1924 domain-containing protein [Azospirillum sp.]
MAARKPTPIEMTALLTFHAVLSGAFIVAYLSGDEDTYGIHVFSGYAALIALALRAVAGLLAPDGSPLRFPRPALAPLLGWVARLARGEAQARRERSPLIAWMAAALLIAVGAAAASGAAADVIPSVDHLHAALGDVALGVVVAHVALVFALHGLKRLDGPPVKALPRPSVPALCVLVAGLAVAWVTLAGGSALAAANDPARAALLTGYAAQAKAQNPGFTGFSAERGRALYLGPHSGGNVDTPAGAACHTATPTAAGRHNKTGRSIEPMATSANPSRFTDPAQVEKRFERDCPNVLGRACTALEKGDFITFLNSP